MSNNNIINVGWTTTTSDHEYRVWKTKAKQKFLETYRDDNILETQFDELAALANAIERRLGFQSTCNKSSRNLYISHNNLSIIFSLRSNNNSVVQYINKKTGENIKQPIISWTYDPEQVVNDVMTLWDFLPGGTSYDIMKDITKKWIENVAKPVAPTKVINDCLLI